MPSGLQWATGDPTTAVFYSAVGFDPVPYDQMSGEQQSVVAAFIAAHEAFE